MVDFRTKNLGKMGKFLRALDWKMLICFMAFWNILLTCYDLLVRFELIWYIFPVLVSRTEEHHATLAETQKRCVSEMNPDFHKLITAKFHQ
jgi:hypothetical protein